MNRHKVNASSMTQGSNGQSKIQVKQMLTFEGPIPPSSEIENYNRIIPGAGDRILAMAEKQQNHRLELEKTVIGGNVSAQKRGVIFGFVIGMTTIIGGILCVLLGHEVSGLIIGGGGLSTLVGIFVYSSQKQQKELSDKAKQLK